MTTRSVLKPRWGSTVLGYVVVVALVTVVAVGALGGGMLGRGRAYCPSSQAVMRRTARNTQRGTSTCCLVRPPGIERPDALGVLTVDLDDGQTHQWATSIFLTRVKTERVKESF